MNRGSNCTNYITGPVFGIERVLNYWSKERGWP